MTQTEIISIALPLALIAIPSALNLLRLPAETNSRIPFQSFFVNVVVWSMLVAVVGLVMGMMVDTIYGSIPGTASARGPTGGKYYFNWHDETYTEVPQPVWERAYFFEQLATWAVRIGAGTFFGVFVVIYALSRIYPTAHLQMKTSRDVLDDSVESGDVPH